MNYLSYKKSVITDGQSAVSSDTVGRGRQHLAGVARPEVRVNPSKALIRVGCHRPVSKQIFHGHVRRKKTVQQTSAKSKCSLKVESEIASYKSTQSSMLLVFFLVTLGIFILLDVTSDSTVRVFELASLFRRNWILIHLWKWRGTAIRLRLVPLLARLEHLEWQDLERRNVKENYKSGAIASASGAHKPKGFNRELEKQIVDKILGEGYDKRIRPSGFNNKTGKDDGPAVVRVNTLIRSISKIDDVTMEYSVQLSLRQEWTDERLAYNRMASYKSYNIPSITLTEQERLWKPDLFFRNEKEGHFHKIILPNVLVRISGNGDVLYSIRISLVLACPMDLKYYPLDKQNCTIEMASYGYLDDDLKFIWKEVEPVQISQPLTLPRFALETFITAFCTSRTATGAYSCLRVDLIFKREFSYYLIQIYIPCCMLVIVSWVSFWLDPNAIPARVSLGVTTLLTMATQISGINASLPPVSYIKAIDVWTGVCLTFVFGALLEFALVNYASRSDAHARLQQARQEEELKARELEIQQRQMIAAMMKQQKAQHQHQHQQQQQAIGNLYGQQQQQQQHYYNQHGYGQLASSANAASVKANGSLPGQQPQPQPQQQIKGPLANGQVPSEQQYTVTAGIELADEKLLLNSLGAASNQFQLNGAGKQCELHHSLLRSQASGGLGAAHTRQLASSAASSARPPKKSVNFCRAWLNKFPSRSKRIDVISRIFFPKMFALFNLVYWTVYLFRDEEIA